MCCSFIAGVDPDMPDIERRMMRFLAEIRTYEGLVEIRLPMTAPHIAVLTFEDKASADVARWMMELAGAEPVKRMEGGADGENGTDPDDDHRQPGNRAGYRNETGTGPGGGIQEDLPGADEDEREGEEGAGS